MSLPRVVARAGGRLFDLLLRAYPADFRRRFGADARADVRAELESAAARGTPAAALASLRAIAAASRDCVAEHVSARRAARRATRQEGRLLRGFASDLRFAARRLRAQPLLTLTVVLTLGLAIGASTSIFSVADAALLKPLPFPDGDRLVWLDEPTAAASRAGVSLPAVEIWSREAPSLESVAFFEPRTALVLVGDEPDRLAGAMVSRSFLDVLGVSPAAGSRFTPAPAIGPPNEVLISHRLWQRLGGREEVLGRTLSIDPRQYRIVGVMAPDFSYPANADFWTTPDQTLEAMVSARTLRWVQAIGRLRPGASLESLRGELAVLTARHPAVHRTGGEIRMTAEDLRESIVGDVRPGIAAAGWAVGLLLIIACCNVTTLLLASAAARRRELAVQTALGATRRRLLRQGAAEILLLAMPASALGVAIAWIGRDAIVALSAAEIPRIGDMAVDLRAFAVAAAATLACGAFAIVIPGWMAGTADAASGLRGGARDGGPSLHTLRLLRTLLVVEVALTFVVTSAGVLLGRSMEKLAAVDTGFTADQVVAMQVNLPLRPRLAPAAEQAFYDDLLARVRALPGVAAGSYVSRLPLSEAVAGVDVHPTGDPSIEARAIAMMVGPGYFETIAAPIVEGRDLADEDHAAGPAVVINELLARRLFPSAGAVGRQVTFEHMRGPVDARVVGVVRPLRYNGLTGDLAPELHLDYRVLPPRPWLVARAASGPALALAPDLKAAVRQLDPTGRATVDPVTTFELEIARELARPRFFLVLAGAFGAVALALAAIGLYGVMAFSVAQRRHEIGVRLALGATPARLFAGVMRSGAVLTGLGLAIGTAAAAGAVTTMRSLLFGIEPWDPATFALSATLVVAIAAAACWGPARRARATDPLTVLRTE